MDYFGWLPESITEASPFHGSMIITDLGSLRIGPIYHHIYNFGTLPVFIAFGAKRHSYELDRHGNMVDRKYVDCKMVMDERTVDGHYYAQFPPGLPLSVSAPGDPGISPLPGGGRHLLSRAGLRGAEPA